NRPTQSLILAITTAQAAAILALARRGKRSPDNLNDVEQMIMKPILAIAMRAAALLLPLSGAAQAESYPSHPVRFIVPFAPAGPTDVFARLMAQKLSAKLDQQFYVENQAGAGGNLAMGSAAHAAPDGYTVLFVSTSFTVNPSLFSK